ACGQMAPNRALACRAPRLATLRPRRGVRPAIPAVRCSLHAAGIDANLTPQIRIAVAVARQAASRDEFEHVIDSRHRVAQPQRGELRCAIVEERISYDHEAANAPFGEPKSRSVLA